MPISVKNAAVNRQAPERSVQEIVDLIADDVDRLDEIVVVGLVRQDEQRKGALLAYSGAHDAGRLEEAAQLLMAAAAKMRSGSN